MATQEQEQLISKNFVLPQKYNNFVAKRIVMGVNSTYKAMNDIVEQSKNGTIFIPDDFAFLGTPDAVRSGLSRMCRNEKLARFAKGVYYKPLYDKWDGSLREPSLDDVAQKIAQRDNARIIPTGTYALNKIGLSTQVPANIVYITDGSTRQLKFGKGRSITFRHSNDLANFAYQSHLMQLVVLAMREIGDKFITEGQVEVIKEILANKVAPQYYNHDIVLAPTWVRSLLQR